VSALPPGRLVGRHAEWAWLEAAAREGAAGTGRVVWLEGEPGIGKTALTDALSELAGRIGFTVLRAAADEAAEPFPLRLMADCLQIPGTSNDPARTDIACLLRGANPRRDVLDPVLAASERMLELVDRLCAAGPVCLVLEDLQWADRPSLAVWRRLASAARQLPLLLVGTAGQLPRRADVLRLKDTVRDHDGVVLELGPLDETAVGELAAAQLSVAPGPRLAAQLTRAGGNPLYVREFIAALVRDAQVNINDGVAELRADEAVLPRSLSATIGRRLGYLDLDVLSILGTAALLGPTFDVRTLTLVLGTPATSLVSPLAAARAAGVLAETDDDRLRFRHGLIREALVAEMAASMRLALHRQFAEVLARAGAGLDDVARHLIAAPGTIEPWVGQWLAGLPETTLFTAPEVAAELLDQIVESPHAAGPHREVLATRLTAILFALGRDEKIDAVAADVLRTSTDPERRALVWLRRLRAASRLGHTTEALAIADEALADTSLPGAQHARIRAFSAIVLIKEDRLDEARRQALLALAQGNHADPVATGYARHALSHLERGEAALAHVEAGLAALGADSESTEVRLLLLNNRLAHLNNLGRRDAFDAAVREVLVLVARLGTGRTARIQWAAAMGYFDFGVWDEASVHLDSLPSTTTVPLQVGRHGLNALIAAHREDWTAMQHHADLGDQLPITVGDARIYSGYLVAAHAMRAEADGDRARAVELLKIWLDESLGIGLRERYMWLPGLVRLALSRDDTETADAAVAAAQHDAARTGALPMQLASAALCRAQRADDVAALLDVAAAYARHGWPLGEALAHEEAAVRLAATGDVEAARASLNEAARAYAGVGATWDLRRADSRLRALGVRRGPRGLVRRPATGWDALTPTELRVAELVSFGRSNPDIADELFLSRRTVQTHVSHILSKLKLRSRVDIIRESALRNTPAGK
jgi:DNA-binding NarL/FixJ family response regulator